MQQVSLRVLGRQAVQSSLPESDWEQNWQFSRALIEKIKKHRIMSHPIMQALSGGELDFEHIRTFHLEFYYGFVQLFTDTVLRAMFNASQIEGRLGLMAKSFARFLLQLNLLEELGFKPGFDGSYLGNPNDAHYIQFCETFSQLSIEPKMIANYFPMASSLACRATFESCYSDYLLAITILTVSESVFHDYGGVLAKGVGQATDIDITRGYHSIHVEDETGESIEDNHAEDGWFLFCQAVNANRYDEVEHHIEVWLNTWATFLDDLLAERFIKNQAYPNYGHLRDECDSRIG